MGIFGWIVTIMISLLTGAVLELNKNTWTGWFFFVLALTGMVFLGRKFMGAWKWPLRCLGVFGFLALCLCIILISGPPVRRVRAGDTKDPAVTDIYSTSFGDVTGV